MFAPRVLSQCTVTLEFQIALGTGNLLWIVRLFVRSQVVTVCERLHIEITINKVTTYYTNQNFSGQLN